MGSECCYCGHWEPKAVIIVVPEYLAVSNIFQSFVSSPSFLSSWVMGIMSCAFSKHILPIIAVTTCRSSVTHHSQS